MGWLDTEYGLVDWTTFKPRLTRKVSARLLLRTAIMQHFHVYGVVVPGDLRAIRLVAELWGRRLPRYSLNVIHDTIALVVQSPLKSISDPLPFVFPFVFPFTLSTRTP
jgi:hypothetical protein